MMTNTSSTFEKTAQSPKAWMADMQLAVVFLTRIPWKLKDDIPSQALNRALRAFPLVGLLVGGFAATIFGLAHGLNLPSLACAFLAILASVLLTGALHEDGLGDVADGFGGGHTVERKLEIMRDSRVGAYGVLAMVIALGLRVSALDGFNDWMIGASALIGAATLSRIAPALLLYFLEPARSDGLAATMEKPHSVIILQTAGLGVVFFLLSTSILSGVIALITAALFLLFFGYIAKKQVGGHTGDVCGASQQIIEIVVLLSLVATQ